MSNISQAQKSLQTILKEHQKVAAESFVATQCAILEKIGQIITQTFKQKRKILLCGNGGSAADAQHIAAEFMVRFKRERRSLPAIALTTDTSVLTATANDYDYESIFERQIEGLGEKGDCLIAISTSGNSTNVLRAVEKAKKIGLVTIGFTGGGGGKLLRLADHIFCAASDKTPHIQEMHITALHAVSEIVEDQLFS